MSKFKFNVRELTDAEHLRITEIAVQAGPVPILEALATFVAKQCVDELARAVYYRDQLLRLAHELDTIDSMRYEIEIRPCVIWGEDRPLTILKEPLS